jgi:sirohydrochlorin ferrochelatase
MIILTDNGSLEPAATLALRDLAAKVSARVGEPVYPVSLLHSSGIDPEKLGGVPAEILEPFFEKQLKAGVSEFKILPLFFGPSLAVTDYIPKRLAVLAEKYPEMNVTVAPCLCDDLGGERLIAGILERNVRAIAGSTKPAVILVDHGSPVRAVCDVRDRLADDLRARLGDAVSGVLAASMERREGDEYAFNEPLLATALRTPGYDAGEVIVAMQFLLPGRHAGPGGDVTRICAESSSRVTMTALVAEDDALADLLAARVRL